MIKQTLYFGNPAYLSLRDKQLVIRLPDKSGNDKTVTRPIEDIGVVVIDNPQITLTSGLIEALLDNNCALISCDASHLPVGLMLPLCGNTTQSERFRYQISASLPLKKQLWQQTIAQKIANQAQVLKEHFNVEIGNMLKWANSVKSGDSDNLEARAAAYYWKNMFPEEAEFIRDRDGIPPNNLLNYGYAVLRAIVARGLVSSGLLPTIGIYHHNKYNAYCLADDIMEPYRPYVDELVIKIKKEFDNTDELTKEIKARLLSIPTVEVRINNHRRPLMVAVTETTASLYRCFSGEARKISYPIK